MIKQFTLTSILASGLLMTSCTDSPDDALSSENMLTLQATHAIEVSRPVTHISFAPKYDLLSYLSMIGLMQDNGSLAVSDIEGVRLTNAPQSAYRQSLGLYKQEMPSAFLTLSDSGELGALIESDDKGNVSPMSLSGDPDIAQFCAHSGNVETSFYGLSSSGRLSKSALQRQEDTAISLSQAEDSPNSSKRFDFCAVTPNGTALAYDARKSELWSVDESGIAFGRVYAPKGVIQMAAISENWLAGVTEEGQLIFWDYLDTHSAKAVSIERGLSIDGLENIGGVYATAASFGGVGFNEGIIALPDANSGRVVILSRSYVLQALSGLGSES